MPIPGGPAPARGAPGRGRVERFKAYRDRYRLKPLLALLIYLVTPLTAFQLVLLQYPDLDPARFRNATMFIIPTALLIVAVAMVQERFPKGERFRLFLDGIYVVLGLLWLLSLIGGSTRIYSRYEGHPFTIDITPLVILAIATAAVNFAHDVLEFWSHRAGAEAPPGPEPGGPAFAYSCSASPSWAMPGASVPWPQALCRGPASGPAGSSVRIESLWDYPGMPAQAATAGISPAVSFSVLLDGDGPPSPPERRADGEPAGPVAGVE